MRECVVPFCRRDVLLGDRACGAHRERWTLYQTFAMPHLDHLEPDGACLAVDCRAKVGDGMLLCDRHQSRHDAGLTPLLRDESPAYVPPDLSAYAMKSPRDLFAAVLAYPPPPEVCVMWPGQVGKQGPMHDGRPVWVRLYQAAHPGWPGGVVVTTCHEERCVNPAHLAAVGDPAVVALGGRRAARLDDLAVAHGPIPSTDEVADARRVLEGLFTVPTTDH